MNWIVPFSATVGLKGAMENVAVEPVPVSETDCGLFVAESVKLSNAVRAPAAVGLKTIDAVQLAEAARLAPQVLLAML